jgi:hypothetical protein
MEGKMIRVAYAADDGSVLAGGSAVEGENTEQSTEAPATEKVESATEKVESATEKVESATEEGEGTTRPAAWQAQGSWDIKSREDLAQFRTITDLVKKYDELNEKVKTIPNVPETYEGYKDVDEELARALHDVGVSEEQGKKIAEIVTENKEKANNEAEGKYGKTKHEAELWMRESFGKDHEVKKADMQRALKLADAPFYELVTSSPVGNNPAILSFLQKVGAMFAEDGILISESQGGMISDEDARLRRLYPSMYKK